MKARNMLFAAVLALLAMPFAAQAADEAGTVLVAFGDVKAVDAAGKERALARRAAVYGGDTLVTGARGSAQVRFTDGSIMALKANTKFRIDEYRYQGNAESDSSIYSLIVGGFRTLSGAIGKTNKSAYQVKTPVATIGIRGTFWEGNYDEQNGLGLGVWDGGITACNNAGCADFGQGANHNFGTVTSEDEEPEGQDEPPPGIGGEGGNGGGDDGGEGGPNDPLAEGDGGTGQDNLLQNLFDQTLQGEPVAEPMYDTSDWRFQGGYFVGLADDAPVFLSGQGDANVVVEAQSSYAYVDDLASWQFYSPEGMDGAEGGVLVRYSDPQCDCSVSGTLLNFDKNAVVIWGDWYSYTHEGVIDPLNNDKPADVTGSGQFIMGDVSPLAVVQDMRGTVLFSTMAVLEGNDSTGAYHYSGYSSGYFDVNFNTGAVDAQLYLSDMTNTWDLRMNGQVVGSGIDLTLKGSSSYMNDGLFGSPVGVTGNVGATFVGTKTVQGVMGGYNVRTTANDPVSGSPVVAHGVFAFSAAGGEVVVP
jgi:hypothetical protein